MALMDVQVTCPIKLKYYHDSLPIIHWLDTLNGDHTLMMISDEFVEAYNKELERMFRRQYCDDGACDMLLKVSFDMQTDGSIVVRSTEHGKKNVKYAHLRLACIGLGY